MSSKMKNILRFMVLALSLALVAFAWSRGYFSPQVTDDPSQTVPGIEQQAGTSGETSGQSEGNKDIQDNAGSSSQGGTPDGQGTSRPNDHSAVLDQSGKDDKADASGKPSQDAQDSSGDQSDQSAKPVEKPQKVYEDWSIGGTLTGEKAIDGEVCVWEDAWYDTAPEVALYIHAFGGLPDNYMTKKQAENEGWRGGPLSKLIDGMSIGGDTFSNYEKILPVAKGRTYKECDIETTDARERGAKRIVFSNDGLVYYTDDHYETFTQLY